jgi:hypothetical protein
MSDLNLQGLYDQGVQPMALVEAAAQAQQMADQIGYEGDVGLLPQDSEAYIEQAEQVEEELASIEPDPDAVHDDPFITTEE